MKEKATEKNLYLLITIPKGSHWEEAELIGKCVSFVFEAHHGRKLTSYTFDDCISWYKLRDLLVLLHRMCLPMTEDSDKREFMPEYTTDISKIKKILFDVLKDPNLAREGEDSEDYSMDQYWITMSNSPENCKSILIRINLDEEERIERCTFIVS
jgi:hypothetical protein